MSSVYSSALSGVESAGERSTDSCGSARGEFTLQMLPKIVYIIQDHVAAGDQEQGDEGGKKYTESKTHGHGYEKLSLEAAFQNHWR